MKEGEEGVSKDKETVVPEHRGGVEPITTGMDCYNVQNWKFGTAKRTMYYDYMYYHCCQKLKREVIGFPLREVLDFPSLPRGLPHMTCK